MINVVGHDEIKARFTDTLPLNVLLFGPEGIGKRRLSHYIAECHAKSFDILTIEPTVEDKRMKPVSIGQVREAGKFIAKKPFGSKFKIVTIDCSQMSDEAAQALLRMLEEPPSRTRFILSTSGMLPLTILSRCARVQVSPLSEAEVYAVLEMQGFSGDIAKIAAHLAAGSVATALAHINNSERRRTVLSMLYFLTHGKVGGVIPIARKWGEVEVAEAVKWFEDLLLMPFGHMSSYTYKELEPGKAFTVDEVTKYLTLLRTPMRPSLKMIYLTIRILETQ